MVETIVTKWCPHCKQVVPASAFYRNRSSGDGLSGWCKVCIKDLVRQYSKTQRGKERDARGHRKYRQTIKGRISQRRADHKTKAKYPDREDARTAVNNAVKAGKLRRVTSLLCHKCGSPAHHYHHHLGYAPQHWLDVVPECRRCHHEDHSTVCHLKEPSQVKSTFN